METTYHRIFSESASTPEPLRIIPAHHVSAEKGTGLVHCAPAHGQEDFLAFTRNPLSKDLAKLDELACPIDENGQFTEDVNEPRLVGKAVLEEGNELMVDVLKERGVLIKSLPFKHRYPYDWKTKKPVLIRFVLLSFLPCAHIYQSILILFGLYSCSGLALSGLPTWKKSRALLLKP